MGLNEKPPITNIFSQESTCSIVPIPEEAEPIAMYAPIVSSYNDKIRPLLDCIDKLRNLKVMQEGIQLPTIVVVGDQSSGKSSVLESLAGISLPRSQGICTRVPLIMRLENHPNSQPEMTLEFNGRVVHTNEDNVADSIVEATEEIAGRSKGISNTPLTLTVKKNGVPDLTMVDLPGITRVPVHGQPADIYEQVSAIIMEYIKPDESIILNVLSASVDFPTCESIRMSQKVDKTGERTLAVVTKPDKTPEGLLEKVTTDDVNIGLGYVVVRNRIGNESYEEARAEEALLFESHPLLSMLNKNMVGIPVLAQKLVQIQASIISKCLPDIVRKINDKLSSNVSELNKLPRNISSFAEALTIFMRILADSKESLKKIFLSGEFDEYPDHKQMHGTARLSEMFNLYAEELNSNCVEKEDKKSFLLEEIAILEETKGIGLPNFLPRTAFMLSLQKKVKKISSTPLEFISKIWNYAETVIIRVLMKHSENYPQLQSRTRRAAENTIALKMEQSTHWIMEFIEMETIVDYTCQPEYISTWTKLMEKYTEFMEIMNNYSKPTTIYIEGFGNIDVGHLRNHVAHVQQAFDLKMRMTAYWKIVLRRLVDLMALHMTYHIRNVVYSEMETAILHELMDCKTCDGMNGIEKMLEESPFIAEKRYRLNRSVKLLKESKDAVAQINGQGCTQWRMNKWMDQVFLLMKLFVFCYVPKP